MYRRYEGNTGRHELRAEPGDVPAPPEAERPEPTPEPSWPAGRSPAQSTPPVPPPPPDMPPGPGRGSEPGGLLRRLLGRLEPGRLETDDLLLAGLLYLLWRESGDVEFLYIAGAYLFL